MRKKLENKKLTRLEYRLIIISLIICSLLLGSITTLSLAISLDLYVYTNIKGNSMHETLSEESKVLAISPKFKRIKRGDIVHVKAYYGGKEVYSEETGEFLVMVKRVIGLPNETISIKGNKVYINNELIEEPYAYYSGSSDDNIALTLGPDQYFVMGDNRMDSLDSRFFDITNIEDIIGVALIIKK